MKRQPHAEVRVIQLPHLAADAVRVEIDCRYSTTGLTHIPNGVELPTPALVTAACFEHESRCGECDTSEAHAKGAQDLREETERAYEAIRQHRIRYYAHGRRNS